LSAKTDQIEYRRAKVIELRARGLSYQEVAEKLEVSKACINADIGHIRKEAKETIKEYTTDHFPEQYRVCLCALDTILRHAFEILQTSPDNREKIAAMELFKDTHLTKLELLSNATTIDSALEFIKSKQSQQKNGQDLDSTSDDNDQLTKTGKQTIF
jgi:predicted transcriptional regulator